MDTSLFLARLFGPMLVVLAIGLLARQDSWRAMANDFVASRPLLFLSGFLTLLGGLAVVNTHNVWEGGWPVIITILGWLAVDRRHRAHAVPGNGRRHQREDAERKDVADGRGRHRRSARPVAVLRGLSGLTQPPACVRRRGGAHCRRSEGRRR